MPPRRWGGGHVAQAPQLSQRPRATRRQVGVRALRQAARRPDEVRQARVPRLHPGAGHPGAVTDQEACPVVDEGREGFCGPVGMHHGERRCVTDQHPQPLACVREKPGRFIKVIDGSMACLRGDGQGVGLNRLHDTVQDFLDGSQAEGARAAPRRKRFAPYVGRCHPSQPAPP
jgi:hypothetical protein